MDVTISDVGHTLAIMDLERDRLDAERVELQLKLENNCAKTGIINAAMKRILECGLYNLGEME